MYTSRCVGLVSGWRWLLWVDVCVVDGGGYCGWRCVLWVEVCSVGGGVCCGWRCVLLVEMGVIDGGGCCGWAGVCCGGRGVLWVQVGVIGGGCVWKVDGGVCMFMFILETTATMSTPLPTHCFIYVYCSRPLSIPSESFLSCITISALLCQYVVSVLAIRLIIHFYISSQELHLHRYAQSNFHDEHMIVYINAIRIRPYFLRFVVFIIYTPLWCITYSSKWFIPV